MPDLASVSGPLRSEGLRLIAWADVRVRRLYPAILRLWRHPGPRAALIVTVLLSVMLLQARTHLDWKLTHLLIDYELGFVKRGLLGEIVGRVAEPVTLDLFFWLFAVLYLGLVALMTAVLARLPRSVGILALLLLATGPMLFRNVVHDWGRLDLFGLASLWLVALALVRDWPGRAVIYALAPLTALFHEVAFFILCPAAFLMIWLFEARGRWIKLTLLTGSTLATGLALMAYGVLDVPVAQLNAHMAARTPHPVPEVGHILAGVAAADIADPHGFILDKLLSIKFAAKAATAGLLLYWFLPPRFWHGRIGVAAGLVVLAYLPLFALGTDSFRWLALLSQSVFVLFLVASVKLPILRPRRDRLYPMMAAILVPALGI